MSFGYPTIYLNGLNNNSQLRRSTDMIYQRGGTYGITLTGSTYEPSMQLDFDIYVSNEVKGSMSIVPYSVVNKNTYYQYNFNFRPYDYLQNFVEAQHYQYYWLNDWYSTTEQINWNNPYPNIIQSYFKYGYRYTNSSGSTVTEYTNRPTRNLDHFTDLTSCLNDTALNASGFTNTGAIFDYVGGAFQIDEHYILPNFDQQVGTTMGNGNALNTVDVYRQLSMMNQFLMDGPSVPEQSETGRFLTDSPRILDIQSSENYVLYYLNGQTGDRQVLETDFAVFKFYDLNNNLITEFNQELNFSGTTYATPTGYTDTLKIFALPCGPIDINNIFAEIDFESVAYYTVQLCYGYPTWTENRNALGPQGPISEIFYFYLYNNCLPENTRIGFLNNRGGYDYFTFRSYRQDTKKIKTQTYDSRYYSPDVNKPDRNFGRNVKTFATDVDQEIVLESSYLNLSVGHWLEQLFYSPQVYMVNEDYISKMDRQDKVYKDLVPLQILSTEVETITKKHQKLNKYRITLKTANGFFVNKGF